jgi:Tol biopolymer transport system component
VIRVDTNKDLVMEQVREPQRSQGSDGRVPFLRTRRFSSGEHTAVFTLDGADSAIRKDGWTPPPGSRRHALIDEIQLTQDHTHLAFTHARPEADACDLWVCLLSKNLFTKISDGNWYDEMPVWSPDGMRLAFYRTAPRVGHGWGAGETTHPAYALWVWDRRTKKATQVAPPGVYADWGRKPPVWLPDGSKILFQTAKTMWKEPLGLYIVDAQGGNPVRLSANTGSSRGSVSSFAVSPDGNRILYIADATPHSVASDGTGRTGLAVDLPVHSAFWSCDGRQIILCTATGAWYLANPDGTDRRSIVPPPGYRILNIYTYQE